MDITMSSGMLEASAAAETLNGNVRVTVTDTGGGVDQAILRRRT